MKRLLLPLAILFGIEATAQLTIEPGATLMIESGAVVTVQGNVSSQTNIQGTGKLVMKGSSLQQLSMNGNSLPSLEVDNASNVALSSPATITTNLNLVNGKIVLNDYDLTLASAANVTNAGATRFIETNGDGYLRRSVAANGSYSYPVGNGTRFTPVSLSIAGASLNSATPGVRSAGEAHPQMHIRSTDHLNTYWAIDRTGISGGTVTATGTYVDAGSIVGTESQMRALKYENGAWLAGTSLDPGANTVTANISANQGDLFAMNRFVLVTPVVMLQGAYNSTTGLMDDRLRNINMTYSPGVVPASNLLPSSDPYRTAPYNGFFTHIANPVTETLTAAALQDKANPAENIVDWVFVELRNSTSNSTAPVVQTRSALLRRDGKIVDVDGVSPLYFKNVDAASNYVITVRHRNHLGISTKPATPVSLALTTQEVNLTNGSNLMGTGGANWVAGSKAQMYAGNAHNNGMVNYTGLVSDKDYLYITVLNRSTTSPLNGYSIGDLNMNRIVNYTGLNSDKDFLYIRVLNNSAANTRIQAIPTN